MLRLRQGETIRAPAEVDLWNHFNAIWRHECYTANVDVPSGGVVIDVGANIGLFSLLAARTAGMVYAYEPGVQAGSYLVRNVRESAVDNVVCLREAVAGRPGERLLVPDAKLTAFRLADGEGSAHHGEPVPCVSLEQVFRTHGLDRCDFLKLDCEGSEFEILEACPMNLLESISAIVMEIHETDERSLPALVSRLRRAGFDVHTRDRHAGFGYVEAVRSGRG